MRVRLVVGGLMCLLGILWFFQGIGVAKGSFMTGHAIWSVFGTILVVVGAAVIRAGRRVEP